MIGIRIKELKYSSLSVVRQFSIQISKRLFHHIGRYDWVIYHDKSVINGDHNDINNTKMDNYYNREEQGRLQCVSTSV